MSATNWKIEEHSRHAHTLTFDKIVAGQEVTLFVSADHHVDNTHCRRDLLTKHLREAEAVNAPAFFFGDTFCAMQGKWDRRADQNQLRPEHRVNNYLDALKKEVAEFYRPHAKQIALISPGNHEQSILDRHQTDLTQSLVDSLQITNPEVKLGGYWGFVEIIVAMPGKPLRLVMHYHHGYGGGGEVTRGLIDHSRTRAQYDADFFISGHIHRRNAEENIVTRLVRKTITRKQQVFLRCASYKDETDGWHAAQGRASRPLGGWWITLKLEKHNDTKSLGISYRPAV